MRNFEIGGNRWIMTGGLLLLTVEPLCILPGSSVRQDVILSRLQTLGLQRPPVNIERKRGKNKINKFILYE